MLRKLRIASQLSFFAIFCLLFFFINTHPRAYSFPAHLLLLLNPLTALLTETAARAIIPLVLTAGLAVAVCTVVFGRFFCGFICPLGACIDFTDRFLLKKWRTPGRRPPRSLQRLKYIILFALAVLSLFGVFVPLFMDPVALFSRTLAAAVNFLNTAAGVRTGPAASHLFYGALPIFLLFLVVLAGGLWDRRFWCQYVCPSGALFGLLSRLPLFRRAVIKTSCTSCGACANACPVRAIDPDMPERTRCSECILCGQCTGIRDTCSAFRFAAPVASAVPAPDLSKRHFLAGAAGGALIAPLAATKVWRKPEGHVRLVRPPGAVPEEDFLSRCIACGNCIKACPSNALQPCTVSDGFGSLFTPKIVPRIGACDPECRLCGYVCPTDAIRRLLPGDKPYVKTGTAVVDTGRCIAWAQSRKCLVCSTVCPWNAIEPRRVQTAAGPLMAPVVHEELCTGCGMCEKQCPVSGRSAIEVYRFGETRKRQGGCADDHQKRKIDSLRKNISDNLISGRGTRRRARRGH